MKGIGTLEYTPPFQEVVHCLGQFLLKVLGDGCAENIANCVKIAGQKEMTISDAGWVGHLETLVKQLQDLSGRCGTCSTQNHPTTDALPQPDESESLRKKKNDHRLVQITADEAEVRRRIAGFINSKREDVNEANIREFCFGLPDSDSQNRCARVDAVFVSHTSNATKSRVNVKRIFNTHGPQTHGFTTSQWSRHRRGADGDSETYALAAIEERLANAEGHLGLGPETKANVFERLQALEERILFLESLSPEYFQDNLIPPPKRQKVDALTPVKVFEPDENTGYEGILELDQQIFALEQKLKEKIQAEQNLEKIITDCI